MRLFEGALDSSRGGLIFLAPARGFVPPLGWRIHNDDSHYHRLLHDAQRLRGRVYLEDGAISEAQLTSDGRHWQPLDATSWHVLAWTAGSASAGVPGIATIPVVSAFKIWAYAHRKLLVPRFGAARCAPRSKGKCSEPGSTASRSRRSAAGRSRKSADSRQRHCASRWPPTAWRRCWGDRSASLPPPSAYHPPRSAPDRRPSPDGGRSRTAALLRLAISVPDGGPALRFGAAGSGFPALGSPPSGTTAGGHGSGAGLRPCATISVVHSCYCSGLAVLAGGVLILLVQPLRIEFSISIGRIPTLTTAAREASIRVRMRTPRIQRMGGGARRRPT